MRKFFLHKLNKLLLSMITLLTVNSCSDDIDVVMAEYGVPEMKFSIKGKVLNEDDLPIRDIFVSTSGYNTTTDSLGEYELDIIKYEKRTSILFNDIDDSLNGKFTSKDTTIFLDENEITELNITLSEEK